jgi:hypothetical protein
VAIWLVAFHGGGFRDAPGDPLRDLSVPVKRDTVARCQPAFPQFIDFIIFNPASLVQGGELPGTDLRHGAGIRPLPDCG